MATEIKVSLTRAFIIRKRILSKLGEDFDLIRFYQMKEVKGSDELANKKKEFEALRVEIENLGALYGVVNTAIDKANSQGPRAILNNIEVLKTRKRFYQSVANNQSGLELTEKVFDAYKFNEKTKALGDYEITEYEPITNLDFKEIVKTLEKDIQSLEDSLADENAKMYITFDEATSKGLIDNNIV